MLYSIFQVARKPGKVNTRGTIHFRFFINIVWSTVTETFNKSMKTPSVQLSFQMIYKFDQLT